MHLNFKKWWSTLLLSKSVLLTSYHLKLKHSDWNLITSFLILHDDSDDTTVGLSMPPSTASISPLLLLLLLLLMLLLLLLL